ncbi:MAG: hypothetical protein HDQ88_11050 [Clostridia bacterium]|nr:hypothetical protein [Clostridia bacterium]
MPNLGYIVFVLDITELLAKTNMGLAQRMIYAWQTDLFYAMIFIALGLYANRQIKDAIGHYRQVKERLK